VARNDFYNILGVERTATPTEIKKAYRALAMRWHPDRNADDPIAEARFKDISEAYRILSDDEKRARYDRLGPLFQEDGRPPTPDDLQEAMGRMWSNLWGRDGKNRGTDAKFTLTVTLEEVATGVTREMTIHRKVRCRDCDGVGAQPADRVTCSACSGTGRSRGARLLRSKCFHCDGRGFEIKSACPTCHGEGVHPRAETLAVKVPKGVASGQKLKLKGKGDQDRDSGLAGDVFVVIDVAEHKLFQRRGADLVLDVPLTLAEAAAGADVAIPTLTGRTTVRVPPGTQPGKLLRLAGRGLPDLGSNRTGDLHLHLLVEIPVGLTREESSALQSWASSLPAERHPAREALNRAAESRS